MKRKRATPGTPAPPEEPRQQPPPPAQAAGAPAEPKGGPPPAPPPVEPATPSAEPAAPSGEKPPEEKPRKSSLPIAIIAGAALGGAGVLGGYLVLRPEAPPGAPPSAASPFASVSPSTAVPSPAAESPPPAPPASLPEHPAASFAAAPRATIMPPPPSPVERDPQNEPTADDLEPEWTFEGVVFDLLTERGVFAAKLSFLDDAGNVVGQTETGPEGRYRISLSSGGAQGYSLRIVHPDYADRHLDDRDPDDSLRAAPMDQRKLLMRAAPKNIPWIGEAGETVRRDLALLPRSSEEP